jgi:hypothetical protein
MSAAPVFASVGSAILNGSSRPRGMVRDQWNLGGPLLPQHFLYFLSDPHRQGPLQPIFGDREGDLLAGAASGFRQYSQCRAAPLQLPAIW